MYPLIPALKGRATFISRSAASFASHCDVTKVARGFNPW